MEVVDGREIINGNKVPCLHVAPATLPGLIIRKTNRAINTDLPT